MDPTDPARPNSPAQLADPARLAEDVRSLAAAAGGAPAVVLVDHGSRRAESNDLLLDVARMFQQATGLEIVEPAHMELAEPSIDQAFEAAVARGATLVVVAPYFLAPGRHWTEDIPRLAAEAAARHPGVRHLVTAPLGLHPALATVLADRVRQCLSSLLGGGEPCDLCRDAPRCRLV